MNDHEKYQSGQISIFHVFGGTCPPISNEITHLADALQVSPIWIELCTLSTNTLLWCSKGQLEMTYFVI